MVWLSRGKIITDRTSIKLDHKRLGPYKVVERIGSLAYRLELPPTMKIHPVFHASRLSPFIKDTIPDRTPEPLPPVVTPDGEEEWEVEEVIGWHYTNKCNKPGYQYKIKWKGYPTSEDSYEPPENLENCPDLVDDYHRKNPTQPRPPPPRPSRSSTSRRRT